MNYIEAEKNELRANRENFLAYEHGDKKYARSENSDEEMSPRDRSPVDNQRQNDNNSNDDDSEEDRWEKEQIRKGVLISQVGKSNRALEF